MNQVFASLGCGLKHLINLKQLKLDLCKTYLGESEENMTNIAKVIRLFPSSIQYLELNLQGNRFEKNLFCFKYFGESFKHLSNLKHFKWDLSWN